MQGEHPWCSPRGQRPVPSHTIGATNLGLFLLPRSHRTLNSHTHHFSLSSLGGSAPVDFSNPSSFFPIIVCEPCGAAALTACEFGVMPVNQLVRWRGRPPTARRARHRLGTSRDTEKLEKIGAEQEEGWGGWSTVGAAVEVKRYGELVAGGKSR